MACYEWDNIITHDVREGCGRYNGGTCYPIVMMGRDPETMDKEERLAYDHMKELEKAMRGEGKVEWGVVNANGTTRETAPAVQFWGTPRPKDAQLLEDLHVRWTYAIPGWFVHFWRATFDEDPIRMAWDLDHDVPIPLTAECLARLLIFNKTMQELMESLPPEVNAVLDEIAKIATNLEQKGA